MLIPRKGTLNNIFYLESKFWTIDTLFWTEINTDIIEPRFLYYYLKTINFNDLNIGSAVPSLNTELLNNLDLVIPSLTIQKEITKILSSLDKKIEVNNKINEKLEIILKDAYRNWFIDFEFPNEGGLPYLSNHGKVEDSELGKIPLGWQVRQFNDVFNISYGRFKYNSKMYMKEGPYKIYGANGVISYSNDYTSKSREIIVGCRGTCGNVSMTDKKSNITPNSLIMKPNNYKYYHLNLLKNFSFLPYITGSTQPQITIKNLSNINIIYPTNDIIYEFEKLINPIEEMIYMREQENEKLVEIRDLILPKLINGEIIVPIKES